MVQVGFTGTLCNSCQDSITWMWSTRSIAECRSLEKWLAIRTWEGSEQMKYLGSLWDGEVPKGNLKGSRGRGREKTARCGGGEVVGEKREKTQNYLVQGRTGSGVFSLHVINIWRAHFVFLNVEFRIKGFYFLCIGFTFLIVQGSFLWISIFLLIHLTALYIVLYTEESGISETILY